MEKLKTLGLKCLILFVFFAAISWLLEDSVYKNLPNNLGALIIYVFIVLFKESEQKVSISLTAFFSAFIAMIITAVLVLFTSSENWHLFYLISLATCIILGRLQLNIGLFNLFAFENNVISRWDFAACVFLVAITNGLLSTPFSSTVYSGISNLLLITTISGIGGIALMLLVIYVEPLAVKTWKWFFNPA